MSEGVVRVKPYHFVWVLDTNKNVSRIETGPKQLTLERHEEISLGPEPYIVIPPSKYCIVKNPIIRDEKGEPQLDTYGNFRVKHGEREVRTTNDPFLLYPGETLDGAIQDLTIVEPETALKIKVVREFTAPDGTARTAGQVYTFRGPAVYFPAVEEKVLETVTSTIVEPNQALKLCAQRSFVDRSGTERRAGEVWLWHQAGAYLPDTWETVVELVNPVILKDVVAVHLRSTNKHTDEFGNERSAGEEWLLTHDNKESYMPDVFQQVVGKVKATVLAPQTFAIVKNPVNKLGDPQWGRSELRRGPQVFFLQPGEVLEGGVQNAYILKSTEALLLRASADFNDGSEERKAGEIWLVRGPVEYIPSVVEIQVLERREAIPLDTNEGVYVRDKKTGEIRLETACTVLLAAHEEIWEKPLPLEVETLLKELTGKARDTRRVVSFRAPANSAVQIYDYQKQAARIVFGPALVMLQPDEQVTVWSLSGDKPKRPHVIKALALLMGPEFMTDIFVVETSDHAKLSLKLSYNWHFRVDQGDEKQYEKTFSVPDFVGQGCQAIAARVRGAAASVTFDDFHKRSARIIRESVFGTDEEGKIKDEFVFEANNLVITNIDIQSAAPVDQRTRESLVKSVQQAIEITTAQQESNARHDADRAEQLSKGELQRQKLEDDKLAEALRQKYVDLEIGTKAVEQLGEASAAAEAVGVEVRLRGETRKITEGLNGDAALKLATTNIEQKKNLLLAGVAHKAALSELNLDTKKQLSEIESDKFAAIVKAIGSDTIEAMALAGPEMQARLLKSLGITSMMITDSNSPVNLFTTAKGLVATDE